MITFLAVVLSGAVLASPLLLTVDHAVRTASRGRRPSARTTCPKCLTTFDAPVCPVCAEEERRAASGQLWAHLTPRCACSCHDGVGHCAGCCQSDLCRDCLAYAMGV